MEAAVLNIQGGQTGRKVTLSSSVFAVETPSDHAIYQDVRLILANRRQGTHKTKGRGEVSGSSKKMYRQKGTGNARQGTKRAPHHRHGGRVFGPVPHLYGFKMNHKQRLVARRSALTYKARETAITIIENINFDTPKTKQFLSMLENLKVSGKKVLLLTTEINKNVYLSGRNIPYTTIIPASDVSTYDVVRADVVVMTEGAVGILNEQLA
jgi:large subunit ribosomal protein L4